MKKFIKLHTAGGLYNGTVVQGEILINTKDILRAYKEVKLNCTTVGVILLNAKDPKLIVEESVDTIWKKLKGEIKE